MPIGLVKIAEKLKKLTGETRTGIELQNAYIILKFKQLLHSQTMQAYPQQAHMSMFFRYFYTNPAPSKI